MEERRRLERGLRDSVVRGARDEAEEKVMIMMIVTMVFSDLNLVLYNPSVGEGDIENKSVVWVRGEYCMTQATGGEVTLITDISFYFSGDRLRYIISRLELISSFVK